jgi:nucleoside-diphosphate-sugar epimerase
VTSRSLDGEISGFSSGTVLVTGATGFLGAALVRRLVVEGAKVRVLVRAAAKARRLTQEGVDSVVGDITDNGALEAAADGVAIVYHLAGKLLVPGVPESYYHRTHVEGTKLLLACCRRQPELKRFVHCSTTGVLGGTGDRAADENAPRRPTNIYEATKAEAELAVRAAWRDRFPAVIVRPGLVYGPGDLHLLSFFRSILRRQFRPIGHRPVWLHPIYIDDMTEALIRCGVRPAAVGECFHVADREPVTLEGFATLIARAAGRNLPPGRIPLPVARAVAAIGDLLPASMGGLAPLTRSRLEFLTHSRVYDVAKAQRLLDFAASIDLPTGIARTMAWYREQGYLPTRVAA